MSETKQLVADLDKKVDQLLSHLQDAKTSVVSKDQELNALKNQLTEKNQRIQQLEDEKKELEQNPPVQAVESESNAEEIKVRINELVKEIDNCISLLKV